MMTILRLKFLDKDMISVFNIDKLVIVLEGDVDEDLEQYSPSKISREQIK